MIYYKCIHVLWKLISFLLGPISKRTSFCCVRLRVGFFLSLDENSGMQVVVVFFYLRFDVPKCATHLQHLNNVIIFFSYLEILVWNLRPSFHLTKCKKVSYVDHVFLRFVSILFTFCSLPAHSFKFNFFSLSNIFF